MTYVFEPRDYVIYEYKDNNFCGRYIAEVIYMDT